MLDNTPLTRLRENPLDPAAAPSCTSPSWTRRDFLGQAALGTLVFPEVGLAAEPPLKKTSVFYPPTRIERAVANAKDHAWVAALQKTLVETARPWAEMSDDDLWDLMFGSTLPRSWMVWSNGHCPACKKDVPMYSWEVDALRRPWKVRCPHCREVFPQNDFARFYRSGLDEHGVFDPRLADRKLLFNTAHPDPKDPMYKFGYEKESSISQIGRLALTGPDDKALAESNVAIEVRLADGSRDVIVAADVEDLLNRKPSETPNPVLIEKDHRLRVEGEMGLVRLDKTGKIARLALCRGSAFQVGDFKLKLKDRVAFIEIHFDERGPSVVSGDRLQIEEMSR